MVYLPPDAQDRMLDKVTTLSAPGSRFASENISDMRPFTMTETCPGATAGADTDSN
jgi:O-methyltransferase involved in polyketide biosynthesis